MTQPEMRAGPAAAEPCLSDDLLRGTKALAEFIFADDRKARSVQHMHETKQLPTFKLAGQICGRKSTLLKHLEKLERTHNAD
jgi:hypothetical protein